MCQLLCVTVVWLCVICCVSPFLWLFVIFCFELSQVVTSCLDLSLFVLSCLKLPIVVWSCLKLSQGVSIASCVGSSRYELSWVHIALSWVVSCCLELTWIFLSGLKLSSVFFQLILCTSWVPFKLFQLVLSCLKLSWIVSSCLELSWGRKNTNTEV